MPVNAVALAQALIRLDTINPPGREEAAIAHLEGILAAAGFATERVPLAAGRPNLMARIGGAGDERPLAFTGHVDTVPLGAEPWSADPFAAEIKDGRMYGRGASDMKAGVAAFVAAAIELAPRLAGTPGVALYVTVAEETGAQGAFALARRGLAGGAGGLVVAEPTSNRPLVGHKGALWLEAVTRGVTAHGSMPEKGDNAVYKAARAVTRLEAFDFNVARHAVMGAPTLNVGTLHGGLNVNSVPDRAAIGIDIRTIPGMRHVTLMEQIASYLGPGVSMSPIVDVESVWTDPAHPWVQRVLAIWADTDGGEPAVETAPYFTDASALTPALGHVPTVIFGPGPPALAHQTDEWCEVARIEQAVEIYGRLIADWCRL